MKIKFIRHAEKEEIGEDPYLTKRGIEQAEHLAKRLSKEKFDEFYCSNLKRAKQTAGIISKKIKMKPKIENSLNEFRTKTMRESKNKWGKEEKGHYNKLKFFLKSISKNPKRDKSILIVAHGFTNRIILCHFLKLTLKPTLPFVQSESGINSVYWVGRFKNWRLQTWNDDNHVPKELKVSRH